MGLSHKARKKQWNMTSSGRESPNYGSKKALQSIASNHMPVYEGTNQVYAVTAGATEPAAFAGVHRNHYFDTIRRLHPLLHPPKHRKYTLFIRALDQATFYFMEGCRVVFSFTKKEISTRQGQYLFLLIISHLSSIKATN